jgi:hypothetical protein
MKTFFYLGILALAIFEILKVYFIMPMPGSQEIDSLDIAYFLHSSRWYLRLIIGSVIVIGAHDAFSTRKNWIPLVSLATLLVVIYYFNFSMTAEKIFLQPAKVVFKSKNENVLNDSSVVIAVEHQGIAKAYPVRFIVYHHQVRDTLAGKQIMVTYCVVCRTGRVFEPIIDGKNEDFRLVGMDHFNAMFEDRTTHSWWQQSTGVAVTGSLKGKRLPELESSQLTLNKFFSLYPFGTVMQEEQAFKTNYDSLGRFEKGKSRNSLTRTDSLSWKEKSWVIGVEVGNKTKAYDWIELKTQKIVHDTIDGTSIVIALSNDGYSFAAFRNPAGKRFSLRNDSLVAEMEKYDFAGRSANSQLPKIKAYQEFWHSWKTFHPATETYSVAQK